MQDWQSSSLSYAEYEYKLANEIVIPLLKSWNVNFKNKKLIDIGCGLGGSSIAFAEQHCHCIGIDISEKSIEFAIKFAEKKNVIVSFLKEDICYPRILNQYKFDLAIFRDVIEHVYDPEGALNNIFGLLKEKGLLFVSFPPFYSPFGGHQHGRGAITRFMPYVHLLPNHLFLPLLPSDEAYRRFVKIVKSNKISIAKFEKLVKNSRFKIDKKELYLFRPIFKLRYGIPAVKIGIPSHVPLIKEVVTTGCIYLLKKMQK